MGILDSSKQTQLQVGSWRSGLIWTGTVRSRLGGRREVCGAELHICKYTDVEFELDKLGTTDE